MSSVATSPPDRRARRPASRARSRPIGWLVGLFNALRATIALSLFWRTFALLALLLFGGVFAWVQTFRALEFEPRAVQAAQQIASLVNLSRAALRYSDSINRVAVV